jgi:hypothetical protein
MAVSEEHAEQRLVAALRATAAAVAADTSDDHQVSTVDRGTVFTIDLEPGAPKSTQKRLRWLPVTVAAAVAAVIAAVAVVLAGTSPSRVQPGGPGEHRSPTPTPSVPYATSSAPSSGGSCTNDTDRLCATPAPNDVTRD